MHFFYLRVVRKIRNNRNIRIREKIIFLSGIFIVGYTQKHVFWPFGANFDSYSLRKTLSCQISEKLCLHFTERFAVFFPHFQPERYCAKSRLHM